MAAGDVQQTLHARPNSSKQCAIAQRSWCDGSPNSPMELWRWHVATIKQFSDTSKCTFIFLFPKFYSHNKHIKRCNNFPFLKMKKSIRMELKFMSLHAKFCIFVPLYAHNRLLDNNKILILPMLVEINLKKLLEFLIKYRFINFINCNKSTGILSFLLLILKLSLPNFYLPYEKHFPQCTHFTCIPYSFSKKKWH